MFCLNYTYYGDLSKQYALTKTRNQSVLKMKH